MFDLSLDIHRHGIERGLWGDEMMIVDFDDQPRVACGRTACMRQTLPRIATHGAVPNDVLENAFSEAGTAGLS